MAWSVMLPAQYIWCHDLHVPLDLIVRSSPGPARGKILGYRSSNVKGGEMSVMFHHILLQSSQTLSGLKTEASDFIKVQSVKIKNWDVWWACMLGTYSVYTHGISHFYISHVLLLKTSQALTLFLELLLDGFSVICCCYIPGTCFTGSVPDNFFRGPVYFYLAC